MRREAAPVPPGVTRRAAIGAIIFDCDGTLVDSETPGLDVLFEFARGQGATVAREAFHQRFRGVRMADVTAWIARQIGADPAAVETGWIREVRAEQARRYRLALEPLPGARELLDTLSALSLPYCVATNGPREKFELTLSVSGLREFFGDRLFSAYDIASFKPDPGLFLHAAQVLRTAPAHCAVVEDSWPGIAAGQAAGMRVFSLLPRESLPGGAADDGICFITGLPDLRRRLLDGGEVLKAP